jgi:hypothetical protein
MSRLIVLQAMALPYEVKSLSTCGYIDRSSSELLFCVV